MIIRGAALCCLAVACAHPAEPHWACPVVAPRATAAGVVVNPQSALGRNEVRLGAAWSRAGDTLATHADEQRALVQEVGVRLAGDALALSADWSPVLAERVDPTTRQVVRGDYAWSPGNLRAGLGLRSFSNKLGGLYRQGLAIHSSVGIDLSDSQRDVATAERLSAMQPFERPRLMPGQYYDVVAEGRWELAGCHSPFLHIEGGAVLSKDATDVGVPLAITIGGHPNPHRYWRLGWFPPHLSLFGGYDVMIGHLPFRHDGWEVEHRMRVGVRAEEWWGLQLDYAAFTGPSDGFALGLHVEVPIAFWSDS